MACVRTVSFPDGRRIINISSIGAQTVGQRPRSLAYAATKPESRAYFILARESAPRHHANVVSPDKSRKTNPFCGAICRKNAW
jgi:NAD(P)-dependent dehydrogenase (short-subunit alcohol dehydrogenase family)